ncbi:MAG: pilus assembly protein [Candidatus Dormibacteraeota bacterium]|nr:pilus assembly protein [Candidatus Dormibacteraeota bacterium]
MRQARGQALMETAIVLPVMVILMLGFLAILIRIEAQVELETATSLAAAAAVAAPANSSQSRGDALDTWQGTLHQYAYLRPGTLSAGCGPYQPGQTVVCRGTATLDYGQTPMGLIVPGAPIEISASAAARGSPYRST